VGTLEEDVMYDAQEDLKSFDRLQQDVQVQNEQRRNVERKMAISAAWYFWMYLANSGVSFLLASCLVAYVAV